MTETAERMSRVDTAWLRMDSERNLMMIVGIWLLQPAIDLATLSQRLQDRLLRFDRFRQKVERDALGARWVADADFELGHHVRREALDRRPGQSERAALQARAAELAATPLNPARPLWQVHLVEHYETGSALVIRIHHCIADGIALAAVLMSITDGGEDLLAGHEHASAAHGEHDGDWLADAVIRPLTGATVKAIEMYGDGVVAAMDWLSHPQASLAGSLGLARGGLQVLRDAAALALLPDDSPTQLKGRASGRKQVAWCEPLPLDRVKVIGKALNCSINDVLLSCVAGALGQYLREHDEDPAGKDIRAMVPVNLRPLDQAWQLGNRFGLAPVVLPVGIDNPVERVYAVRQRMAEMKGSTQPLLAFGLLALEGLLPQALQDGISAMFLKKTTAVMTNVPGPRQLLSFCGRTLRQNIFWVPSSGDVGLGVSICSYAGGVQFGLITDAALCSQPQAIIDRFGPEFEKLLLLALMLPWAVEAGRVATPPPWPPLAAAA